MLLVQPKISLILINTAKMTISSKLHVTTKPSLNFSVVVPKLFKQKKKKRETTQKRAFFLKRFYSVIS